MPNNIPVEIQLVAVGNAETVQKINQVSQAAKKAGTDGFGALEHFLIRVSGGNRELMMGLRGLSQLMQGANGDATKFGAALQATLIGVGIGAGAVAIVHLFETISGEGKRAFEEAGLSSHGFFADLEAGLGIIDPLNAKLEASAAILERLNRGLEEIKRNTARAIEDSRGTTEATGPKRAIEDVERRAGFTKQLFAQQQDDLKKELASLGGMSRSELLDEFFKVKGHKLPFFTAATFNRNDVQSSIEDELRQQAQVNFERLHKVGTHETAQVGALATNEVDATKADFWRTLEEKSLSSRISGRPDMLTDFLLHNSNATVGGALSKLGVADPYGKSPEAASKLLEPLFRGIESQAERLREDALHPHIAPLAVAGTAEAWRQTVQYKQGTGAETVQEKVLTQAQIQTALLQSMNSILANLTVHGGN